MTSRHTVIPAQAGIQWGEAITGFPIGVGNDMHDRMNEYYVYISDVYIGVRNNMYTCMRG